MAEEFNADVLYEGFNQWFADAENVNKLDRGKRVGMLDSFAWLQEHPAEFGQFVASKSDRFTAEPLVIAKLFDCVMQAAAAADYEAENGCPAAAVANQLMISQLSFDLACFGPLVFIHCLANASDGWWTAFLGAEGVCDKVKEQLSEIKGMIDGRSESLKKLLKPETPEHIFIDGYWVRKSDVVLGNKSCFVDLRGYFAAKREFLKKRIEESVQKFADEWDAEHARSA